VIEAPVAARPPMGWNSYDCFSYAVNEAEVKANADFMAARLKRFGWEYVVVDYVWSCPRLQPGGAPDQDTNYLPRLAMDANGRLLPDSGRFPSAAHGRGFRPLADYVHREGLKFGIHVMRGIPRQAVTQNMPIAGTNARAGEVADRNSPCPWLNQMWGLDMARPGAQAYLDSLLKLYAAWGVDFIKVDDLSSPYHTAEVEGYRRAIDRCGRQIVFSTSPGETPLREAEHVAKHANMWRLLGDLWDNWKEVDHAFEVCAGWSRSAGPGHWPDPDMLPLGRLRKYGPNTGPPDTFSRLTHDEATTLMTLWCIDRCPLMFGGNLPETDPFTFSLITNAEALAVDQLGSGSRQLVAGPHAVWVADAPRGGKYLALFNRADQGPAPVSVQLADLGWTRVAGALRCNVRDLWARKDLGAFAETFSPSINAHGAGLYRLTPREYSLTSGPPGRCSARAGSGWGRRTSRAAR
jgi:hypothetical protein